MSRVVYGNVSLAYINPEKIIYFVPVSGDMIISSNSIAARLSEDNQFALVLDSGAYKVQLHTDKGIQDIGIVHVVSSTTPISLKDLLNVTDGGNRADENKDTIYIMPSRLNEMKAPVDSVDMSGQKIIGLASPEEDFDACNKMYTDSKFATAYNKYTLRTIEVIDKVVVNKVQLHDAYKVITIPTPVALDNAFSIFPEYRLVRGQGAIVLLTPTINGNITVIDYTLLQVYFENMTVMTFEGAIFRWIDIVAKWVLVQNRITRMETTITIDNSLRETLEAMKEDIELVSSATEALLENKLAEEKKGK